MAPSAGKSPPGTQIGPPKMSTEISIGPNNQPKVIEFSKHKFINYH